MDPTKVVEVLIAGQWVSVVEGSFWFEPTDEQGNTRPEEEFAFGYMAQDSSLVEGRLSALLAVRER